MRDIRCVIVHTPGPKWRAGAPIFEQEGVHEHIGHYRQMLEAGKLMMGGPFLDAAGGGMMIAEAGADEAEMIAFANADPAVHGPAACGGAAMAGGRAQGLGWRGFVAALLGAVCLAAMAQPQGGTAVSIDTADFSGRRLQLPGVLWAPAEPAKGAVVLVHGSGGWSDFREGHYGRAFSAAGYAALAIDTFGPRGIANTTEDQSQLSALQMTRDAFAARRFLVDKGFAAEHLAVMGFSKGGTVALYAADRNFLPKQEERFALAIPFYAGCNARPRTPKPASIVFMALGEKDDYTGMQPCQDVAADFMRAGGTITVKVYPDSSHGFDGNPALTGMTRLRFVENFKDCVVYLEEDGRTTYGAKTYAAGDATLMADMRSSCVKKGANIWTNPTQKDAATRDVIEFLNRNFAR